MPDRLSIGLTGGIACGKSAAAALLAERGLRVLDADEIARRMMEPGGETHAAVVALFGEDMLDAATGRIDRGRLGRVVFAERERRQQLERVVHPPVYREIEAALSAPDRDDTIVAEIPLLFETGAAHRFDQVWTVACSPATQWQRMRQRQWSEQECRARLNAQWPLERKMEEADLVLWNEFGREWLAAQIDLALSSLGRTRPAAM